MSRDRAQTIRLIAVAVVTVATVTVANWRAAAYLLPSNEVSEPLLSRTNRIRFLAHDASNLPPPLPPPQFLLMGNSHTYTLPGIHRGEGLRINAMTTRRILLDELMDRLDGAHPATIGSYYLLAYPNFLPYEMLTRVAQLYLHGYKPDLVAIGITWRNIARDSQLRYAVRLVYREHGFAEAFLKMLNDPAVHAHESLFNAIEADARRVKTDEQQERVQSDADRLDSKLTDWIGQHLTLLGDSANLRANVQLDYIDPLQNAIVDRVHKAYDYDLVEPDYQFNLNCLRALLRLFHSRGAQVICYLAPQRSDVPPLMDPTREEKFNEQLKRETEPLGAIVLDARHVVPNEYWGWEYDSPDRSHFTEPGHQRLAEFLADEIERRHLWPPATARKNEQ
jgi:hypothetical protein